MIKNVGLEMNPRDLTPAVFETYQERDGRGNIVS